MRKRFFAVFAVVASLGMLTALTACNKDPAGGGDEDLVQLDAVDESSFGANAIVSGNKYSLMFYWDAVNFADGYKFTLGGVTAETERSTLSMKLHPELPMPADGDFEITLVATSIGYRDSEPTFITYKAEIVNLDLPEISSYENGVLKWQPAPSAAAYHLVVNGEEIVLTDNQFDTNASKYSGKPLDMTLTLAGDGVYTGSGKPLNISVNAAHTKLCLGKVQGFKVKDGELSWDPVIGAKEYRVVDVDRNVHTVKTPSISLADLMPVYGVYAVSSVPGLSDGELLRGDIPYLEGDGTAASPYIIKTTTDLWAVDYYEALTAEDRKTDAAAKRYYRLDADLDYATVAAPDDESNIYPLNKPFYGVLDGNGKTISNIRVYHSNGYWALFDMIAPGGEVKNFTVSSPYIYNELKLPSVPIQAVIATVAYRNCGTISGVTVESASYTAIGGEVAGICYTNSGTISGCSVGGTFLQKASGQRGQACYEMAGIAVENYGTVRGNTVTDLTIKGSSAPGDYGPYNCVRCAAGIVAVNRTGGVVSGNNFVKLTMTNVLDKTSGQEFGGIVAYCAPGATVTKGSVTFGTFKFNGETVTADTSWGGNPVGKLYGKKDS